jgi:hypothetical protein
MALSLLDDGFVQAFLLLMPNKSLAYEWVASTLRIPTSEARHLMLWNPAGRLLIEKFQPRTAIERVEALGALLSMEVGQALRLLLKWGQRGRCVHGSKAGM